MQNRVGIRIPINPPGADRLFRANHRGLVLLDVVDLQTEKFTDAQSGVMQEHDNGAIPVFAWMIRLHCFDYALIVPFGDRGVGV